MCLLPIATAAAELQSFYEDVASYAALTDIVPLSRCRIFLGEILLEVVGPAETAVSWAIVQAFANEMRMAAIRGYTNTYQMNYINRGTMRMLTFNLYVGYMRALASTSI